MFFTCEKQKRVISEFYWEPGICIHRTNATFYKKGNSLSDPEEVWNDW